MARYLSCLVLKFEVPLGETTIGWGPECLLTLDDPLVSRRHARIVAGKTSTVLLLVDGDAIVTVNGVAVAWAARLRDGDCLKIGSKRFIFSDTNGRHAASPPGYVPRMGRGYEPTHVAPQASGATPSPMLAHEIDR